jgi:TRAP-type C4-dicarboxylate transport system permease small subunit
LLLIFDRILAVASHALLALGAIIVGLMAVHVIADVSARYLFNQPLPGTIEIVSLYYMVAVIYLPVAYVQSRRQHIVVTQFTDWLPARARLALDGLVGLLATAVLALLAWRGVVEAMRATELGQQSIAGSYSITSWPPRWFVPFGLGVMALYTITQSARDLAAALSGPMVPAVVPGPRIEDV